MSTFRLIKAYFVKAQREDLAVSYLQQDTIRLEGAPHKLTENLLG